MFKFVIDIISCFILLIITMKTFLFLAFCLIVGPACAQVGIGTTTPSPNAVLDVSSPNKGLMLPRVGDTLSVRNPTAGLMIFDRKTNSPAFHNGSRWNTVATAAAAAPGGRDSLTYTISGGTYTAGALGAVDLTWRINNPVLAGGGGAGQAQGKALFYEIDLTKYLDANTVAFLRAIAAGTAGSVAEIRVYTAGAALPYFSVKLTSPRIVTYYNFGLRSGRLLEQISLTGTVFGYKDWVSGVSFGWDTVRNAATTY